MIHVDWDELQLADIERARVERRIAGISIGPKDVFTVRRVIHGYQAILSKSLQGCGTELRVHGNDLVRVLECVRALARAGAGGAADASRWSAGANDRDAGAHRGAATQGRRASTLIPPE